MGSMAVGLALLERQGFAGVLTRLAPGRLRFGALDPLVDLLQATPAEELLPPLVERLRLGATLEQLVAAGALANARAHGGTYYDGYHALMALVPSLEMAARLPRSQAALPVLKVLHRNTRFIHDAGRAQSDALAPLEPAPQAGGSGLVASLRGNELAQAEQALARGEAEAPERAYEELQAVVRDEMDVHRVVLAWRAHDLLRFVGDENAVTMLRQSVRYCVQAGEQRQQRGQGESEIRPLLSRLMEEHGLAARPRGTRPADAAWIERLTGTVFSGARDEAARAVAAALAEGYAPEPISAALSLAATRLLLHDRGRSRAEPGKPVGSVHGASVGVHASDAANAWRHLAAAGSAANGAASLIAGAYHTAGQSVHVGAEPYDLATEPCRLEEPAALLDEVEARIRACDQGGACQATRRYCALGHPAEPLVARLLVFALSEDGALHAEKYFHTAVEEHSLALPEHRPLFLVGLTRVMASHFGFPAPGLEEARTLLAG